MRKQLIFGMSIIACVVATNTFALEFGKPIKTTIVSKASKNGKKDVVVMNFKLSPSEQKTLFSYQPKKSKLNATDLPSAISLGMNGVPVLDQGFHGSCVTFATTAAVDAVIGNGDYISQLCNLELGSYLENKSYMPSGWDGSFGPWVYDQMLRFGIVSKENQTTRSCAGVTAYPLRDFSDEGKPFAIDDFKTMSEDVSNSFYPNYYMNFFQRFDDKFSNTDQVEHVLGLVKQALAKGNRLTFGTFIVLSPYCSAGACASYHAPQDTWALTKEIQTPPFGTGGHEMVITGYDDNAVATDSDGNKHQGLLILRNSWGEEAGDNGNYYMTYDYFKKFVGEVEEIVPTK